jgi:hypothetical protein
MRVTAKTVKSIEGEPKDWRLIWQSKPVRSRPLFTKVLVAPLYAFIFFVFLITSAQEIPFIDTTIRTTILILIIAFSIILFTRVKGGYRIYAVYDKGIKTGNWMIPWNEVRKVKYLGRHVTRLRPVKTTSHMFKIITTNGLHFNFDVNYDLPQFEESIKKHRHIWEQYRIGTVEHMIGDRNTAKLMLLIIILTLFIGLVIVLLIMLPVLFVIGPYL